MLEEMMKAVANKVIAQDYPFLNVVRHIEG